MLKLLSIGLFSLGILLSSTTFDPFLSYIQNQQTNELSRFFDDEISLTLGKQKGYFTKSKAEDAIQQFFKEHPVQKVFLQSTGTKDEDQFAIGKLIDKSGKSFRLYLMGKEKNRRFVLLELRFQE